MMKPKAMKLTKEDFLKLNEDDILFITNPGRMGDEDGSTFIVRNGNEFTIYRVDGWMYPNEDTTISLDDALKQFPMWHDAWENGDNTKYKHLYMGFGNGISIDHSIVREYEPYLNELVERYLGESKEEKDSLQYAAIYNSWEEAFLNMLNDKKWILKNAEVNVEHK